MGIKSPKRSYNRRLPRELPSFVISSPIGVSSRVETPRIEEFLANLEKTSLFEAEPKARLVFRCLSDID